jgi:hypothetical protein
MNSKLSFTFILASLLLAIWHSDRAPDAHAEWEHIPGTEVIGSVSLLESDGLRLYAIGDTGFYLSFDGGYTWRRREIGRGIDDFYITAIGSGDGVVYVGTSDHGVIRSVDDGNTWKRINEGLHIFDEPKRGPHYGKVEQILVTGSDMVINVGYHRGTHISNDRGETWRNVMKEWKAPQGTGKVDWAFGNGIWSMTEFDGYLWAVYSNAPAFRSPDEGGTWEILPTRNYGGIGDFGRVYDWAELGDELYAAGSASFGRWNEAELAWDHLSRGLPDKPGMSQLAVSRGRIYAVFIQSDRGVWLFDQPSETWVPVGMQHVRVYSVVSHQSDLYAGTDNGIYRAAIPIVHSYGKAPTTWGVIKQK